MQMRFDMNMVIFFFSKNIIENCRNCKLRYFIICNGNYRKFYSFAIITKEKGLHYLFKFNDTNIQFFTHSHRYIHTYMHTHLSLIS